MPTVAAVEEVNANDVKTTVYEVKVENGLLQINKCVGDNKTAILSEEISENVFPSEDIDELKKVLNLIILMRHNRCLKTS